MALFLTPIWTKYEQHFAALRRRYVEQVCPYHCKSTLAWRSTGSCATRGSAWCSQQVGEDTWEPLESTHTPNPKSQILEEVHERVLPGV